MNSFVDTNVAIAYIFSIDPLNNKSMAVFREYDNIYWSKFVKREFNKEIIISNLLFNCFYINF